MDYSRSGFEKDFKVYDIPAWLQKQKSSKYDFVHKYVSPMESSLGMSSQRCDLKADAPIPGINMNQIPSVRYLRTFIGLVCVLSFFVAPFVYMPLGSIQALYGQQCFLYTKIHLVDESDPFPSNVSSVLGNERYILDPELTEWGPESICNFATYTGVSVAIGSIIIAWSTLQIWPEMMSNGAHCYNLKLKLPRSIGILNNLENTMLFVEWASWCLTAFEGAKVLLSVSTFCVICFHFCGNPEPLHEDWDNSDRP